MNTNLIKLAEEHVDHFLELLANVRDGEEVKRTEILLSADCTEPGWEVSAGDDYVDIAPRMGCGFSEHCCGKLLTVITERVYARGGSFRMYLTEPQPVRCIVSGEVLYLERRWRVQLAVPGQRRGEHFNRYPGVAALIAYLRAWDAVPCN
ncbi:hypothetical protein [Deinococcus multiflagellatus]|uniref:Uncharacterized protein n=1 Tax=Deinococcus multiflagellatus TaxID=1656887 RepID=A0ABW1ZQX7_9DEIO|nr:hypothetical protein [Deinococcus multiflagellatus]MBZ9715361.1 hypothetical protein [Deinococcus multiflagellatus]